MDITICINRLGLHTNNTWRLTQAVPPHSIVEWSGSDPQPTQEELEAAWASYTAEHDAQAYARNRKAEYPSIVDQLDDIFHNGIDGWKATIQVTKDKYPKE